MHNLWHTRVKNLLDINMVNMKNKTVMVTGSGGFIGTSLVKSIKSEYDVIPIKNKSQIDLLRMENIDNLPYADVVIHLAGVTYVPFAWDNPHLTYEVNINTTLNMLEFARRKNIEKIIFPSTYVYGKPQYLPIDEKHPTQVLNPYNRSKLICEDLCKAYNEDYGIKVIILRIFNIYGPGQPKHWLIPAIISQLSSGVINLNDRTPKRDFVYISDVVRAFKLAIDYQKSEFEIFNIGSGVSYQVADIVDLVLKMSDVKCNVIYGNNERKNEIMETLADISKAKDGLKWVPKISFEEGLESMFPENSYEVIHK